MSQISFAEFFDQAQDAAPVVQHPLPALPVNLPAVSAPVLSLAAARKEFISVFHETAYNLRRWEVFSDFIILAASELDIARIRTPESIERCRKISERYSAADMRNMHELFALMVCALQAQFHDFLGAVFMELELGDDRQGQYFTPYNVQSMMARLLMPGVIDTIRREGMFTLSEPTCRAGGMVIGAGNAVTVVFQQGFRLETIEDAEAEKAKQEAPQAAVQQAAAIAPTVSSSNGSAPVLNPDEVLRQASQLRLGDTIN